MARLHHRIVPGCTFFVTTKSAQSAALFQVHAAADIIVAILQHYREAEAYQLHAFVLMPNHLHVLLTPSRTTSIEKAMQLIKGASSHEIHKHLGTRMEIWQSGFHEATIRDASDYLSKIRYIHQNPVAAGLAPSPEEWAWSSASARYSLDPIPQGLKPGSQQSQMSELKLRPPNGKTA